MVDLLNACLRDEMKRDPRIVLFGEDVADASREEVLAECKGKGGVFKVTHRLQRLYGSERVFNSPLAEANIVGRAIGMAVRGLKPVVEIQFYDYIWPAYMQIHNELSNMRWRSGNAFSCPVVIRVAIGRLHRRRRHLPLAVGRRPDDAHPGSAGRHALQRARRQRPAADGDPLRRPGPLPRAQAPLPPDAQQGVYPGPDYMVPFGKASVGPGGLRRHDRHLRRDGLPLLAGGAGVHRGDGQDRSRSWTCAASPPTTGRRSPSRCKKTSRALVVYEDPISWGYGAEIAARISSELFSYLDAPVERVAATDTFVAYQPQVEDFILPQASHVRKALDRVAAF